MTDYSALGLDSQLRPVNSPATNNTAGSISAFQFDSENERNVITSVFLKNFSFTSGTGGILTLGGYDNGSGILQIKDSGGTQRVVLNNEGITVNDGSIVIKNSLGSVIMNQTGLTTVNFLSSSTTESSLATNSGTAFVTLGTCVLDFELNKRVNILSLFHNYIFNNAISEHVDSMLVLYKSTDGTTWSYPDYSSSYRTVFDASTAKPIVGYKIFDADGSGTYNYWRLAIEWRVSAGTASSYNRHLDYVMLGS